MGIIVCLKDLSAYLITAETPGLGSRGLGV